MEAENKRKTRLQKLSGSDFEIVDGQPDIRGWDVKDSSGKQLGEVEELIFDYESRKVRYLVVDLDENDYDLDDREVLIPIGIAELHENDDDVILPGVTPGQLTSLPEYDEDRFDTDHEASVRNVFGGLGESTRHSENYNPDNFYEHEHFNESNLYRRRTRSRIVEGDTRLNTGSTSDQGTTATTSDKEKNPYNGIFLRERMASEERYDELNPGSKYHDTKDNLEDINTERYKRSDD